MVRSDARMKQLGDRQGGELNKKLGDSKGRWLALGAAIYGAHKMIRSAGTLEEQGNYLRTVINTSGDKDAAVGQSMQHARSFARGSLATQQKVLDIEYALNSAGISEEVSRAGTELVHKLAKFSFINRISTSSRMFCACSCLKFSPLNPCCALYQNTAREYAIKISKIGQIIVDTTDAFVHRADLLHRAARPAPPA